MLEHASLVCILQRLQQPLHCSTQVVRGSPSDVLDVLMHGSVNITLNPFTIVSTPCSSHSRFCQHHAQPLLFFTQVVRGSPSDVLDVLMHGSVNTTILGPARTVEVLQCIKDDKSTKEVCLWWLSVQCIRAFACYQYGHVWNSYSQNGSAYKHNNRRSSNPDHFTRVDKTSSGLTRNDFFLGG